MEIDVIEKGFVFRLVVTFYFRSAKEKKRGKNGEKITNC